ncbi:type II toxin-antitoxin system death-on-curing family toxin [Candidatus Parcubacteria bacterium]|nr:type II toxin-antitoxin system death-on-curing family toxin [Candidatus Parcubacteria bacterium]
MNKIQNITIKKIKHIAHEMAVKTMGWDEPIPEFETRFPNVLESCIVTPFQKYEKKYLYKGLTGKAAILFYLLIKNHPFQNGNKRIAVTALLVFLYLNNKWLSSTEVEMYNLAKWIAASPPEAKEEVVQYIEKFIRNKIVSAYK